MRASRSTGLGAIRRSGLSTSRPFDVGSGNPYRGERGGLAEADLARLAQLEQREERDRLLDPRQAGDLGVEVEAAAPGEQRAEALEELGDGREAERHVPERDVRRRRGERAERRRERRRPAARAAAPRVARAAPARGGTSGRARLRAARRARRRLLHAPVLGEPPRELLRGLLGLEVGELGRLVREERARLQLEQGGDEHEELAAGLEVELVALGEELDEGQDDRGDVHLARLELLLEQERQQEVERALEGVEVELELAHRSHGHARRLAARPDAPGAQRSDSASSSACSRVKSPSSRYATPPALPEQHVPGEARALLDRVAELVEEQQEVRVAAQERAFVAVDRDRLDPRARRRELLQQELLVDRVERRLRHEEPAVRRLAVEEPDGPPVAEVDAVRALVELRAGRTPPRASRRRARRGCRA